MVLRTKKTAKGVGWPGLSATKPWDFFAIFAPLRAKFSRQGAKIAKENPPLPIRCGSRPLRILTRFPDQLP
jgi:hypothetical protein